MGNCATICSSDGEAEKKAKEIYMSSRPPIKKLDSQSITDESSDDEIEETETDTNYMQKHSQQSYTIDSKTIELLSPSLNYTDNGTNIIQNNPQDEDIPKLSNTTTSDEESDQDLAELERNITCERVKKLTEIMDADELKNILNEQYSVPSDDDSSLSETDKQEIKYRKSSLNPKKCSHERGPSLYRDSTAHDWDEDDIDVLTNDMEKQFLALQNNNLGIPNKNNKSYKIVVDDNENGNWNGTKVVESKIFRNKSAYKWDMDDIEATKEDMQKEMMNLMLINQENKVKDSIQ
eukprot:84607_1